jgi:transposase
MHAILDILRLRHEAALSERAIARSLRVSRSTVSDVLTRAQLANLNWPLSAEVDEAQLEALLYTKPQGRPVERAEPSWSMIHQELRRKGVTLYLLWMEYKEQHSQGLQYSQFCHRYREWAKRLQISMRQNHRAGDKLFVDYAGPTMRVVDPVTGESQPAQLFVAVLGASNLVLGYKGGHSESRM